MPPPQGLFNGPYLGEIYPLPDLSPLLVVNPRCGASMFDREHSRINKLPVRGSFHAVASRSVFNSRGLAFKGLSGGSHEQSLLESVPRVGTLSDSLSPSL